MTARERRRRRQRALFARIAFLRRAIGAGPYPAPLPIVAPPWSRRRWYLQRAEVQRLEALAYARQDEAMRDLEALALLMLDVEAR